MKRIKKYNELFETSKKEGKYWKIDTEEPKFEISLQKIGCDKPIQISEQTRQNEKKVFVINKKSEWGWNPIHGSIKSNPFSEEKIEINQYYNSKYEYGGEIEVSDEDIEKYYLEENISFYVSFNEFSNDGCRYSTTFIPFLLLIKSFLSS